MKVITFTCFRSQPRESCLQQVGIYMDDGYLSVLFPSGTLKNLYCANSINQYNEVRYV